VERGKGNKIFIMEKTIHEGRNVKRFREMWGMKQEALADALGDDWNQKKVSLLEAKEIIEPAILEQVAKVLKVPAEAIKNFDEEQAVNIINNIHDNKFDNTSVGMVYQQTINPIERWLEALEENKKLYAALLKEKDEKIALLEKMITKK
jgi:transcriptional regulator with XRE-family HTH domain